MPVKYGNNELIYTLKTVQTTSKGLPGNKLSQ
jgi:hypothetical protein